MKTKIIQNISLMVLIVTFYSCSAAAVEVHQYEIDDNSKKYNTPFINSTETSKLDFGLSKVEVLDILGEPLFVANGNGSTKKIIWIYEVRTVLVESNIEKEESNVSLVNGLEFYKSNSSDLIRIDSLGKYHIDKKGIITTSSSLEEITEDKYLKKIVDEEYVPSKRNKLFKHNVPIHKLALEFGDYGLMNWTPYCVSNEDCNNNNVCFDNECIISEDNDEINSKLIDKLNLLEVIRRKIKDK